MAAEADTNEAVYFSPDEDPASETQSHSPAEADDGDEDEDFEGEELETDDDAEEGDETEDDDAEGDKPKAEEFKEIERGGKKYRIPAELEPELMMQQDYTRKTQEVAEQRRAVEQEAQRFEQQRQAFAHQVEMQRQNIQSYAQLESVNQQIQQYEQLDWEDLYTRDPVGTPKLFHQLNNLKQQRDGLYQHIQQTEHQLSHQREQESRQQQQAQEEWRKAKAQETLSILQRENGWNDQRATQVRDYARKMGYQDQELMNAITDPRAFKILDAAQRWEEFQRNKAAKVAQKPKPQVQPLAETPRGRKAPAKAGLHDGLSTEEWARRREAQLRKRAR